MADRIRGVLSCALPKHYQAQHCSTDPSRRRHAQHAVHVPLWAGMGGEVCDQAAGEPPA